MTECIFCRLIAEPGRTKFLLEDDVGVAFNDINPQAPTHVLVVPKRHIASAKELGEHDAALFGHLIGLCQQVTSLTGIREAGYRYVLNTGDNGGQTVNHLHFHVLGGRQMKWPPG
jgi:histidine triad (HIT) family protein